MVCPGTLTEFSIYNMQHVFTDSIMLHHFCKLDIRFQQNIHSNTDISFRIYYEQDELGDMALQEIEGKFCGVWKLDRSENFDGYLKEVGVNFMLRKMAGVAGETVTITVEGDQVRILTKGPRETDIKFRPGQAFESRDTHDNPLEVTTTLEDGVLYTDAKAMNSKGKDHRITRDIVNGELVQTIKVNDVICKRIYKKS
ncbi:hypothetical protein ScPMuIL_006957 [Solemya velum]